MLLELLTFFLILIMVLVFFSETTGQPMIGMLAALILLVVSYWVLTDDIQIKTGETTTLTTVTNQTGEVTGNDTITGNITTGGNVSEYALLTAITRNPDLQTNEAGAQVKTDTYTTITSTPYIVIRDFLGLLFVLLGIYGTTTYALKVFESRRE